MEQLREKLEEVAKMYFSESSLHGLKNQRIQESKLDHIESLHQIGDEEILFLYDATLFGSAKDGIVLTEDGIYWRERLGSPQALEYRELMESTAHTERQTETIHVLHRQEPVKAKDVFYDFLANVRLELASSLMVYESYYKGGLEAFEKILIEHVRNKEFAQIIDLLDRYEGLFLKEQDKSTTIYKIGFQAYLIEKSFVEASKQLEVLKQRDFQFYRRSTSLLEGAIKEEQYLKLERQRVKAMEDEDYKTARRLLKHQKSLKIREEVELAQVESQMKETHYKSLDEDRLRAIEEGDYHMAFTILEKQRELKVKSNYVIDSIKEAMVKDSIIRTINQYDFEEAKKHISLLPNLLLRKELRETLKATTRRMHGEIRRAARKKDYGYFESLPHIWDYKDVYGMSALEYFALEGDARGMLMMLEAKEPLFMHFNVYGHNFIDLIGLACGSGFGNSKGNVLEILETIKSKADLKQIEDRIKFLKTGQEGHFFSYYLSDELLKDMSEEETRRIQDSRLAQLNEKLMSTAYFKYKADQIENQDNNTVDKIIKQIFGNELEDVEGYPEKGEFERSEDYLGRTLVFKKQYLDRKDFIDEYKRQNQAMVQKIGSLLQENENLFQSSLIALESLQTEEGMLKLYDLYFPLERPPIRMGNYDPDDQAFFMIVGGHVKKMYVPAHIAQDFKINFSELELVYSRRIENGQLIKAYILEYEEQSFEVVDICQ